MSFIVCCQAVRQKQDVVFCKEFLKKSAWEKLSFFPKVLFFSALFFQILSVYDIARRIKRFAPIKRHDMLPVNIVSSDTEEEKVGIAPEIGVIPTSINLHVSLEIWTWQICMGILYRILA